MIELRRKHPLAIRWFHWVNFPLLLVMIWSGILIYWAYPAYVNLPQKTWRALHINNRLPEGMALHFAFMWLFAANGVLYVLYTAVSGQWRELVPGRTTLREAWQVMLHDLDAMLGGPGARSARERGMRPGWYARATRPLRALVGAFRTEEPLPRKKFNGAQQIAYTAVVLMGAGSLLSGLAIYKPVQFSWLTSLFLGYQNARFVHFALTVGYVLFFLVHVAQVVRAGWNNFRAMVIGVEAHLVPEPEPAGEAEGAVTS